MMVVVEAKEGQPDVSSTLVQNAELSSYAADRWQELIGPPVMLKPHNGLPMSGEVKHS